MLWKVEELSNSSPPLPLHFLFTSLPLLSLSTSYFPPSPPLSLSTSYLPPPSPHPLSPQATLVHWTKKIIVEEGHTVAQLTHMLQLLCRHYKVYFPVRQHLVQHMISSIQRLGLTANVSTILYTLLLYIVQDGEKLCVSPKNVQPL